MTATYTNEQIQKELDGALKWSSATVWATFTSDYIGGQPAGEDGVRAFCIHQLGLTDEAEIEAAVRRILDEEVGEKEQDSDEPQELVDKESFGVNVIRHNSEGIAYIGTWQVRACLKAAASRLGIFQKKKGSKGDMSEMMVIDPVHKPGTQEIEIIYAASKRAWTARRFKKFLGCVNTAQGRKSIVHDSEYAPAGCSIAFKVKWPCSKVTVRSMLAILAAAQNIGLGSVKALEHGRFKIDSVEVDTPKGQVEDD